MSKPEMLLDIVTNLRSLATSLEAATATMLMDSEKDTAKDATSEKPVSKTPTSQTPIEKNVTLEQVRAYLADKSLAGFTDEIRGLLEKHGAQKLSQIDPDNYTALLADAEALK